jgi:hypothetical protein
MPYSNLETGPYRSCLFLTIENLFWLTIFVLHIMEPKKVHFSRILEDATQL